jgi:hypothetical protein
MLLRRVVPGPPRILKPATPMAKTRRKMERETKILFLLFMKLYGLPERIRTSGLRVQNPVIKSSAQNSSYFKRIVHFKL